MGRLHAVLLAVGLAVVAADDQKIVMPCIALLDPTSTDPEPCKAQDLWAAHQQWGSMRKKACAGSNPLLEAPVCNYINKLAPHDMDCFATVINAYYKMGYPPPCQKNLPDSTFDQPPSISNDEINQCVSDAWGMFKDLCGSNPSLINRTKSLYNQQIKTLDDCCAKYGDVGATCRAEFELQQVAYFNVFQNKEDGNPRRPENHPRPLHQNLQADVRGIPSIPGSPFTEFAYNYLTSQLKNASDTSQITEDAVVAKMQIFGNNMLSMAGN
ncbi:unnamed protein product, partial [Mesorhabditis spiculigera]